MKNYLIIIPILFTLVLFGYLYQRVDTFLYFNRSKKDKKILTVACENIYFSDMISNNHNVVFQYEIKDFESAKEDIRSGKVDFGLFHKLSVKNISSDFYKHPMRTITDSSYFMDEKDLLDQNVVLVSNKKNVQKLFDLGIIKKRK